MRAASILLLAILGLAAHATLADERLGLSDEALLAPVSNEHPLSATTHQRSVLSTVTPPPYYCANSHLKEVFTTKFAFLMIGTKRYNKVTSGMGANLFLGKIKRRLRRYNRRYKLNLTYKLTQLTRGTATRKKQKWFYYEIQFVVGKCGKYKFPLVTQLRGDIQPSASFLRVARLLSYPVRIK